jgi:predicted O-methyltransferase YrrM
MGQHGYGLSEVLLQKNLENKRVGKIIIAIHGNFFYQSIWATSVLNKKANKCKTLDDIVATSNKAFDNFPFRFFGWHIRTQQVPEEFIKLLGIIAKRQPKVILEIGTASGGTLFAFAKVASPNAIIISVDLPEGEFGGSYYPYRIPYYKSFAKFKQKIKLIRADSHSKSTLDKVKKILSERQLDLLFIDGDHTYEGVRKDFEMYSGLVKKGGLIAFHDICYHAPETGCEVHKFWREIKKHYPHEEIIKNQKQGWAGIGLMYV